MPLVVMCGRPASGKTTIADRLREYLNSNGFHTIVVISDKCNAKFNRCICTDSQKERDHRAMLRSEVQRLLTKECIVICDSMNSIKGFRYELYGLAKLVQTTFTIIYCDADVETCCWLNSEKDESDRYTEKWLDNLQGRFEEPNAKNRWDSPIFSIKIGKCEYSEDLCEEGEGFPSPLFVTLPFDEIVSSVVQGKNLTPNQSTKTSDPVSSNALYAIDKIARDVIKELCELQRTSVLGSRLILSSFGDDAAINFTRQRSMAELSRLRHKFINYMKAHPVEEKEKVVLMFVDFLNKNY